MFSEFNAKLLARAGVISAVINLCTRNSILFGFTDEQRTRMEEEIIGKQFESESLYVFDMNRKQ